MYKKMLKIRLFEEKVSDLLTQGLLPGNVHSYKGQEAVAVGVCANLREDDYLTSTHREHGHFIAKDARLDKMMAELLGKKGGYNKGKGGPRHLFDISKGLLGAYGIVGGGIPIAVGAGLSISLRKTDQVCACFFGDGAANQGTFHEGINLASVWKLPVVFVCENNMYGVTVSVEKSTSVKDIADRAIGYNIPGIKVDGMDVEQVYAASHKAVGRARSGEGPTLIECKTYRFEGHCGGDPAHGTYRTKQEVLAWINKDPIRQFLRSQALKAEEAEKIRKETILEIEDAVKFAMESPYPNPEEALEGVYA
jgi:TPP-dependent pyruvate/acetoin dehydrogenase alpha subunit